MRDLLAAPQQRETRFHRRSHAFDEEAIGYINVGAYVLDTSVSGNSNLGHDYGTKLSSEQKRDVIEYLKTL